MLLQGWRALVLAVAVFFVAPSASADVSDPELATALAYFQRGDFHRAATELDGLVEEPRLTNEDRKEAREALAVSYYVLGRMLDARKQFTRLLEEIPSYQPDPFYVAPEIVGFVADIRRSLVAPPAVTTVTMPVVPAPVAPVIAAPVVAPAPKTTPPALLPVPTAADFSVLDLMPFGAGQFRKSHTGRGTALAIAQGVLLGANVGLYYYRRCSLKPCDQHYYPADSVQQAQHLQTLQLITGSLFVGTAILGIADAIALPVQEEINLSIRPVGSGLGLAWETD